MIRKQQQTTTELSAMLVLIASLGTLGCAATPEPKTPRPPTQTAAADPLPPVPIPKRPPPAPLRPITVVIEPGGSAREPTLLEASRAAKKARENAAEPKHVITNENLGEYAERGNIIIAHSNEPLPGEPGATTTEAVRPEDGRDEAYWRDQVLEIRQDWRRTLDQIGELEEEAAQLRRDFYAEDDPWHRDSQIKPRWDRALDRLRQARQDVEGYRDELNTVLAEGRRAGALPGWLREGIELEPAVEAEDYFRKAPREADAIEPPIYDEGGGPPR